MLYVLFVSWYETVPLAVNSDLRSVEPESNVETPSPPLAAPWECRELPFEAGL